MLAKLYDENNFIQLQFEIQIHCGMCLYRNYTYLYHYVRD